MGIAAAALALHVSVAAREIRPGELVAVTLTAPEPFDHVRVRAFDRQQTPFAVSDREWRVLIGIDLGVTPGTYVVTIDAGDAHATHDLVVRRRVFRTRRLTLDQAYVTPPASVEDRIRREAELLGSTWRSTTPQRLWSHAFVAPVPDESNSAFGTRSILNGRAAAPHSGADFLSPAGRPVRAPNAGRIVIAQELYFSGNTVVIDHGLGLFSLLAHLSEIDVQQGALVEAGQIVGLVGATGRVTGPHLHWGVRAAGSRIDPLSVLALLGEKEALHDGAAVGPLTR